MRRFEILAAASGLAGFLALALTLPPRSIRLADPSWRPNAVVVAGAFHVHTNRSDGAGSIDDVAAAAARAGLKFVVLADHGDATRRPEPASYRSGVLCLDGVEISTSGGHYVAVGMPQAPYPLAGEARDVVDDVARLDGFGVVAHGGSRKSELRWQDWAAPFDALEWLNLDSEWRDETRARLTRTLFTYPLRKPEVLASLISRPVSVLKHWDETSATRRIVALASTDAHGQIVWQGGAPRRGLVALEFPSYEVCFRTLTTRLELDGPLTGNAEADARTVIAALRSGHHYTALDALAAPPAFEFRGRAGGIVAREGDVLAASGPVALEARVNAPRGATLMIFRNGTVIRETTDLRLMYVVNGEPAVYRVEVRVPNAPGRPPVSWIMSNPIYVGEPHRPPPAARPAATDTVDLLDAGSIAPHWAHEQDRSSTATVVDTGTSGSPPLLFRYSLGPGQPYDQFAALVRPVENGLANYDRVTIRARASRPLRISVQLRASSRHDSQRWQRSVYLDATARTVTIFLDDVNPMEGAVGRAPLARIDALLFVIDTNNTAPGTSGEIAFSQIAYQR